MLAHGEHVGQHLGRVPLVGQAVVDRYVGMEGEFLDGGLCVTAVLDGVEHASQYACRVGHGLLVADLRCLRVEDGHLGALVVGRNLKCHAGAGRCLAEDQGNDLAG